MAFQVRNGTCEMKPGYSNRNLSEKLKMNQNLK
jgi:hypothetical protein